MVSDIVAAVVGCLLPPGGEEILVSYLAFSDTIPQVMFRNLIIVWQEWESSLSILPLLTWVRGGATILFGFWLQYGRPVKGFPVPPFSLVLWLEREGFLLGLYLFIFVRLFLICP